MQLEDILYIKTVITREGRGLGNELKLQYTVDQSDPGLFYLVNG